MRLHRPQIGDDATARKDAQPATAFAVRRLNDRGRRGGFAPGSQEYPKSLELDACLLRGQGTQNRKHKALAVEGVDDAQQPKDKEAEHEQD